MTVTDSPAAARRAHRVSQRPPEMLQHPPQQTGSTQPSDPHVRGPGVSSHTGIAEAEAQRINDSKQVLFQEDVDLLRLFSLLVGGLCVFVVIGLPFLRGDPMLRSVLWGGSLFSIFTSAWNWIVLRDVRRYDQRLINLTALVSVLIAYSGVLYLGVHSPGALVVVPGLYFVGRSQRGAFSLILYAGCALMQGVMVTLILTGKVRDPGLITPADTPVLVLVLTQVVVQLLYFGSYLLGRSSRTNTFKSMQKILQAERQVQQREAAFIEVREDLDRMLGAGGVGHYTDKRLGDFTLGGIIGRGAMGEVYEAFHVQTGQLAAAKVLHPHILAKKNSVERFFREAQAAAALQSPHSVQIFGASQPGDPVPYLIMERLQGNDLAHHLREVRRITLEEAIVLAAQVASVIDMAAAKGIVHRDLKPQNLFLAETPQGNLWKVLDFGASKLADHSGTLTQGRVIGTPSYMTPQQARGEDVDGAADRYGLAAIVFRALTGRPPYTGKDLPTTLYSVVYGTPPQPSVIADLPPAVDAVLAIGLAKDPTQRFGSAAEFVQALEAVHQGQLHPQYLAHAEAILAEKPWGMQASRDRD